MTAFTMVGTNDLPKTAAFYDPIFKEIGWERNWDSERIASWRDPNDPSVPEFFAGYPENGEAATFGNGVMIGVLVNSISKIQRIHEIALRTGGSSEGEPGYRPHYREFFYGAYVRDPDGNKLGFICYDARDCP